MANTPNPLEWVAWLLGCRYGVGISYEGPVFEHPDDLVDIARMSRPTLDALTNCTPSSDIASRYCYFPARFTVDPATGEPTNILTAIREIVTEYNKSDNPGRFTVIETVAGPCIVGTSVKSRTGEWKEVQPLLSQPISVSVSNATNIKALEAVLKAVQAQTSARIVPTTLRTPRGSITFHAEDEPARDVIARLLTHPEYGGTGNRWYLFYSACPPGYGFQDMSTERGYVPAPLNTWPWSMVGNVTHPDYHGESAAPVASPDDAPPPVIPRQSSGR
ncbi:MAG: hypothetical protein M5U15_14420 [Kiritimatiellae bacterium]|nr:hypothetical protein [Kiritimatiellia bacterium]